MRPFAHAHDLRDLRRVQGEDPLHPDAVADLAHRECLAKPVPLHRDDDALEHLHPLGLPFDDLEVNLDRVADAELLAFSFICSASRAFITSMFVSFFPDLPHELPCLRREAIRIQEPGRCFIVFSMLFTSRHWRIFSWCPERRISGTRMPRNTSGACSGGTPAGPPKSFPPPATPP